MPPAATYTQRVQEIAALLETLAGVGPVHPRLRLVNNWERFIAFFRDGGGRINGWQVTRKSGSPASPRWDEVYLLSHFRGINDDEATDLAFQEHLDAAAALFRDGADLTFGSIPGGLRVIDTEARGFGNVLCHFAECELPVSFYYADL